MFETWEARKRIDEAKRLTPRVVDHLQYLLDIHENNAAVLYSDTLSKQIPKSYAANALNVFREVMHQMELVRICAVGSTRPGGREREAIPTVIELIDDEKVLDALADQARADHHEAFGKRSLGADDMRESALPRKPTSQCIAAKRREGPCMDGARVARGI